MRGSAGLGLEFDQHAAHLAILEPDVVGPLERAPRRPRPDQRARNSHPYAQAQGGEHSRPLAEGPSHRQRETGAERRYPAPAGAPAARMLQFAQADIREQRRRRRPAQEPGIGGVHVEQEFERAQLRFAPHLYFSTDALRLQQFHRIRQAVAPPRQRLHLDPHGAQALDTLPYGRAAHVEFFRQPLAGAQTAVRQQHQQQWMIQAVRERNSHIRRTRFSCPARMRAILPRWVYTMNPVTPRQKINSGTLCGCRTHTNATTTTADNMVARPTWPVSTRTMNQLAINGTSKRGSAA